MNRPNFSSFLVLVVFFATAQTQTIWTQRSDAPQLRLEVLRPNMKSGVFFGADFSSTIFSLFGRMPIVKGIAVQIELPYTSETVNSSFFSDSKSRFGNPYLGFEFGSEGFPVYGELGFRPMVRKSSGSSFPSLGVIYGDFDRAEAYLEDLTTFQIAINVASSEKRGFVYRVKAGPTIWSPSGAGESTTLLDYGVKVGYDDGAISAYSALTGRWNTKVTSGKSAYHHLGFDVGYRFDKFRPAVFVRIPLDKEYADLSPNTIGGSVSVEF